MSMNVWRVATDKNYQQQSACNTLETILIIASRRYLVENTGVEPVTSCVQGKRSSQLS